MIRTYNDELRSTAELYWAAEEEGNIYAMALWKQWNQATDRNNGKEPKSALFIELLEKLEKCSEQELELLARA